VAKVRFDGHTYECGAQQSVLDALTAHGAPIPSSCRNGICQTCLMQAVDGLPPAQSQNGLKDTLKEQNYFLACSCYPESDLTVALPDQIQTRAKAMVRGVDVLSAEIVRVRLDCPLPLDYRAGQYINLFRDATLMRSYSLASVPGSDADLHLHVRRLPQGRVSGWIHDELRAGDEVDISTAMGGCFYVPGNDEQGLLLIGTGSGLAPLYGILRDALTRGHRGPIKLYHGSRSAQELYLVDELRELAARHGNFVYTPCVSGADVPPGFAPGRATSVALADTPNLTGWRAYLCGHPDMVKASKKQVFLAGASMKDIYADPFVLSGT
jgi:ferredoxin-NADP reductase/ferredoxin